MPDQTVWAETLIASQADVGSMLRAARESLGVPLETVAHDLRIRIPYLRAIEDARFADLPGPAYAVAFLRSYAAYVGFSPQDIVEAYRRHDGVEPQAQALRFPVVESERRLPRGLMVVMSVLLLAGAYVVWNVTGRQDVAPAPPVAELPSRLQPPAAVASVPLAAVPPAAEPARAPTEPTGSAVRAAPDPAPAASAASPRPGAAAAASPAPAPVATAPTPAAAATPSATAPSARPPSAAATPPAAAPATPPAATPSPAAVTPPAAQTPTPPRSAPPAPAAANTPPPPPAPATTAATPPAPARAAVPSPPAAPTATTPPAGVTPPSSGTAVEARPSLPAATPSTATAPTPSTPTVAVQPAQARERTIKVTRPMILELRDQTGNEVLATVNLRPGDSYTVPSYIAYRLLPGP